MPVLQGKGLVRQRSISADSRYSQLFIFIGPHYLATLGLVTFVATYGEAFLSTLKKQTTTKNVTRPSRGHERVYAMPAEE